MPDITFEILDKMALGQYDEQAAEQRQKERFKLFQPTKGRG
jgi:hypothetical protein